MADRIAVILSKNRDSSTEQQQLERKLLAALASRPGVDVTVIPHLYDLSPDGPAVQLLRSLPEEMIVLSWLYPRAAYWVLDANGVKGRLGPTFSLSEGELDEPARQLEAAQPDRTIWCFDLRSHDRPEPYLRGIERIASLVVAPALETQEAWATAPDWAAAREIDEAVRPRWYPVVDFSRCTNCLECLNFCLFGVYSVDTANAILIEQPDACRPGCPACSRICPQGAIMFPQHKEPAIAGDPEASLKELKLDLSQLFGGASPADLAAGERQRALREQAAHQTAGPQGSGDPTPEKDALDRLVDEVDRLDL